MTITAHYPILPTPESKARILKYVDMLWNQMGEQVLKLHGEQDLPAAFVLAYENGAQVIWIKDLSEEAKPLVMAGIREQAAKVAGEDTLVFGALCTPAYMSEGREGEPLVRREAILLHIETPNAEWLMATGEIGRHANGTVTLGPRKDQWLGEGSSYGVHGQMMGFFPASKATKSHRLN